MAEDHGLDIFPLCPGTDRLVLGAERRGQTRTWLPFPTPRAEQAFLSCKVWDSELYCCSAPAGHLGKVLGQLCPAEAGTLMPQWEEGLEREVSDQTEAMSYLSSWLFLGAAHQEVDARTLLPSLLITL